MLNKIFVFVFLFVLVNSQTVDVNAIVVSYPPTVQAFLLRAKQLDVLAMYNAAVSAEIQSAGLSAANIGATITALVAGAQSQVTQLTSQLAQFQTDAQAAFQELHAQLAATLGSHDGLAKLIQQFGDARAALRLECEDLKNLTNVAIAAIKDLAVAKIQAHLAEQQAIIQAAANPLQLATDANAQAALKNKIIDLRAKAKLADQLVPAIQAYITANQGAVTKCLTAVQQQSVALTLGVKNTYDQVKAAVSDDVQKFKDRMTVIVGQAVADKKAFVQNVIALVDDAKQQIKVEVAVAVANFDEATQEIAKKTVKAALEAITLGSVDISITISSKRQASITVSGVISGVSAFLKANGNLDLQAAFDAIQNDPNLQAKIAEYQLPLTTEQIAAAKALIEAKIAEAKTFVQTAQANWQKQLTEVQAKAVEAKAALANAALDVKDKVAKVWAARQAQIEAKKLELSATIENLKLKIPQLQAELQNIQASIQPILESLKTSTGDAVKTLTAQKEALIEALKQKAAELIAAQKATAETHFATLVAQLKAEKDEIVADVQAFAQQLKATATDIHNHVKAHKEDIKIRVQELARAIEANINNITTTALQTVPEGVKLQVTVAFDDTKINVDAVISILKGVIQAEFTSDKVNVRVVASAKRAAKEVTLESNVASTDGSTASEDAAGLPIGAIIGIVAGVVVAVIVAVVVIVVVQKKRNDDDYQSMRA